MERWLHPAFEERLRSHAWRDARVLDIGTGAGNPAFLLGELGATVLGIDQTEERLAEARMAATQEISQVRFEVADAESADYAALLPGITAVTAHLCMSAEIVRRAAVALPRGGRFLFCAHHPDHHRETGRPPTFAMAEEFLRRLLVEVGFVPEFLQSYREFREYSTFEELARAFDAPQIAHWKEVGAWEPLRRSFESGDRRLTRAHVVGDAVRR